MKKHLIAAAVAAAVAVPAMAQVTIGGNFDVSYDFGDRNTTDSLNPAGVLSTSALTIGGTEDLGGGLKAFFTVQSRLGHIMDVDGSTGSATAASGKVADRTGAINFGDRGAQVGISGGFGEVALGKTTGTTLGGIRGGVNGNLSLLSESTWGDRPDHMISITSPSFSGIKLRYIAQTTTNSTEVSATYSNGPLNVWVAANDVKDVAAVTSAHGTAGVTAVVKGKDLGARVSYNLGFATANLSVTKFETITANKERDERSFGISVPVGQIKGLTLAVDRVSQDDATQVAIDKTNVSAVYTLSKRTNVYLAVQDTENNADNLTALGIRHSF